jgi:proteasome lid subunit RPN8/RPN11/predicted RNA-binding Zn-ribbon protein involved in translation (DUF1610 family)
MFYFSINKNAMAAITKEAKSSEQEIIGVLIGRVYDNLLVVNQAVSGEQASGLTRVKLDNTTLAKIIDQIMTGKLEGNILGWYHSHPGFGVFMSQTDVSTQQVLQQFSKKVAALVIDPKEDKYGVFTIDRSNGVMRIPDEQIFMFKDGDDGIPPELKDSHVFKAKLEILPEKALDRIRYVIECTAPYWPEKKCLICGNDLKYNEAEQMWICPKMEILEKREKAKSAVSKPKKFQKVQQTCKVCKTELKYSRKLSAWYCKECKRVYKHRVKIREEEIKTKGETEDEKVSKQDIEGPSKEVPVKHSAMENRELGVEANQNSGKIENNKLQKDQSETAKEPVEPPVAESDNKLEEIEKKLENDIGKQDEADKLRIQKPHQPKKQRRKVGRKFIKVKNKT